MEINLKINGLSDIELMTNETTIERAIARALNRTAGAAFTAGSKKIREKYNIKARDIKASAFLKKAVIGTNEAMLRITGAPIPMKYFGAKQTAKGVTVRILKGDKRTLLRHAFIGGYARIRTNAKGKGKYKMRKVSDFGSGNVFKRKGKKRFPIIKMAANSITVSKLFMHPNVNKAFIAAANETFEKEFWSNYKFFLSKEK